MRKIALYMAVLIVGVLGGAALGWTMRADGPTTAEVKVTEDGPKEYMRFPNEFLVPLLEHGRVTGMVVMRLSLEVEKGQGDAVAKLEPRLRDESLRVLFEHANAGGFKGTFTEIGRLASLRRALLEAAQKTGGPLIREVLITDIAKQDS